MARHSLESEMTYLKALVAAGLGGIASPQNRANSRVYTPPFDTVLWTPAAMGAAIGACSARWLGKRKSASGVAMGGLVGSMVGCGAALAWASRRLIGPAARSAAQRVNAVRDARWLEANPIDYA
jgi:hypothetical protein